MLNEFKKFILKGNVVDLSTGVIIGASFGEIVKAFTTGIVNPLLSMMGGKPDVSLQLGPFDIGIIISAVLGFLITAAVVFFVIVKPVNKLIELTKAKEAAAPSAPPAQEVLLAEIRDLLKNRA
ncbi:MAG: large conductance mechanosensitive channel protein MscL [Planctomyces sp.]|jgi:large conductance mechanosensitive channel